MTGLYDLLAVPFGYIIGFFYDISQNYIFSILVITIITRLILLPSTIKQQRSSASQMRLQAKVRRIQEMYKGNQQKINEETQALYQREGFNPMSSGCLPMLIQFPVMIGLYSAIRTPLTSVLHLGSAAVTALTDAVQQVAEISSRGQATLEIEVLKHFSSLQGMVEGVSASDMQTVADFSDSFSLFGINLADTPQVSEPSLLWLLPIISGATALLTSIFMLIRQKKQNPDMAKNPMMGCTFLLSPAMSIYFGFLFPGAISIYWIIGNILSFIQTVALNYTHKPGKVLAQLMIDETVTSRAREQSIKNTIQYRD